MSNWNLEGKTALVLGGTQGIGLACVEEFLSLGANVIVVARNKAVQNKASFIKADITIQDDRQRIVSSITKLDILVNNVGMNISKPSEEFSVTEINQLLNTNFIAGFDMIRLLLPLLKKAGKASIINIASVAGVFDVNTGSVYASAKAALIQLTRSLAVEYAPYNIRVNSVSPWYTETRRILPVLSDPATKEKVLAATPLKRICSPGEVAATVSFLAMDKSSYITGQNMLVDGGVSAGRG